MKYHKNSWSWKSCFFTGWNGTDPPGWAGRHSDSFFPVQPSPSSSLRSLSVASCHRRRHRFSPTSKSHHQHSMTWSEELRLQTACRRRKNNHICKSCEGEGPKHLQRWSINTTLMRGNRNVCPLPLCTVARHSNSLTTVAMTTNCNWRSFVSLLLWSLRLLLLPIFHWGALLQHGPTFFPPHYFLCSLRSLPQLCWLSLQTFNLTVSANQRRAACRQKHARMMKVTHANINTHV